MIKSWQALWLSVLLSLTHLTFTRTSYWCCSSWKASGQCQQLSAFFLPTVPHYICSLTQFCFERKHMRNWLARHQQLPELQGKRNPWANGVSSNANLDTTTNCFSTCDPEKRERGSKELGKLGRKLGYCPWCSTAQYFHCLLFFLFFPSFFFFFGEEGSSVVGGGHVTQMFPSTGETFVVLRLSIPDLSAGAGSSVCCSEGLVLPGSPQAEDIPQGCGRRLGAAWVTTVSTQSPEVCQLLLTVTVPVLSLPSSLIVFQHREVLLFPT